VLLIPKSRVDVGCFVKAHAALPEAPDIVGYRTLVEIGSHQVGGSYPIPAQDAAEPIVQFAHGATGAAVVTGLESTSLRKENNKSTQYARDRNIMDQFPVLKNARTSIKSLVQARLADKVRRMRVVEEVTKTH